MVLTFSQFFSGIKDGVFGIGGSFTYIANFIKEMWASEPVVTIKNWFMGIISPFSLFLPFILLGLYIIIALTGKRMFGVLRFTAFFVAGLFLGAYLLSPFVTKIIPQIPPVLVGVVTGIVSAVLSKLIYILAVVLASGYPVYTACITGTVIPALTGFCKGKAVLSLVVAVIAAVIVLIFLKYIEMLGTAMLAGLGIAYVIKGWYDFTAIQSFEGRAWIPYLVISSVVGVIGLVVQFRTRRRF